MGTSKENRIRDECSSQFSYDASIKNGIFLNIPLQTQIKQLLSDPDLYKFLTNRNLDMLTQSNQISDITTGDLYKNLIDKHAMSKNDISFTWNVDGIPVFKSSQYSIWPVQCMINELPPHLRSKNMLLTGLWFRSTKPKMNTFLEAFVNERKHLKKHGFYFGEESRPRSLCFDMFKR